MEDEVYTVPTEVLFRNYSINTGIQTRNLLLKNNTSRTLQTIVSYPFSPSFRLHAPADQPSELKSTPPHLVINLQPHSTSKVVIELKPPDNAYADGHQHFHDMLVVLFGDLRALLVPLRAVHHGLDAANPSTAANSQLQQQQQAAAMSGLAFWPVQKELDSCCSGFTDTVRALYCIKGPPPQVIVPNVAALPARSSGAAQGAAGAGKAAAGKPADGTLPGGSGSLLGGAGDGREGYPVPAGLVGDADEDLVGQAAGGGVQPPRPRQPPATAAIAAAKEATPVLPPEGFSQQSNDKADDGNGAAAMVDDEDGSGAVDQQPYVLHKTIKVQGRVAVAVAAPGSAGGDGANRSISSSGGGAIQADLINGSPAAAAGNNPLVARPSAQMSPPRAGPLCRTSSSGAGGVSFSPATPSGGSRPGSGSGSSRVAFVLGGRLYDARGAPLDPVVAESEGLAVVDCGEGGAPHGPRSRAAPTTPPRTAVPSATAVASPSPGTGGRPALAPLRHASSLPPAASLRPISASSSCSISGTPLGRPPPPPLPSSAGTASAPGVCGGVDPLRQAALAAAMRELGISDLPAPSPRDRTGSNPSLSPAMPSYVQYGLPPNYRPSSGTRRPPSTSGGATSSGGGGGAGQTRQYSGEYDDDDNSHDDDDVGARLQQQVEANVLRVAGPGPALPPRRTVLPASSPGSYLPPRAGAAPSVSLGAPSPAAAAAAAVAAGSRMGKAVAAAAAANGYAKGGSQGRQTSPDSDDNYPEEREFEVQLQRQIDSDFAAGGGVAVTGPPVQSPAPRSGGGGGAGWRGPVASSSGTAGVSNAAGGRSSAAGGSKAPSGGLQRSNSAASNASLSAGGGAGGGGAGGSGGSAATGMGRRLSADSAAGDKAAARAGSGGSSAPRQRSTTGAVAGASGTAARGAPIRGAPPAAASGGGGSTSRSAKAAATGGGGGGGGGGGPSKAGGGATAAVGSKANGAVSLQRLKANWDALG